ncbi:MAG: hypothetical protein QOE58_774 [Actinomycetota bacterium]|nr:hypothetical protein [Actinomycetota bacterium]
MTPAGRLARSPESRVGAAPERGDRPYPLSARALRTAGNGTPLPRGLSSSVGTSERSDRLIRADAELPCLAGEGLGETVQQRRS